MGREGSSAVLKVGWDECWKVRGALGVSPGARYSRMWERRKRDKIKVTQDGYALFGKVEADVNGRCGSWCCCITARPGCAGCGQSFETAAKLNLWHP